MGHHHPKGVGTARGALPSGRTAFSCSDASQLACKKLACCAQKGLIVQIEQHVRGAALLARDDLDGTAHAGTQRCCCRQRSRVVWRGEEHNARAEGETLARQLPGHVQAMADLAWQLVGAAEPGGQYVPPTYCSMPPRVS